MAFNDDQKPSTSSLGSPKGLVTMKRPSYSRRELALTEVELTAMLELNATTSTAVREGLDLVAVLDVSSSLQGEKLARMKKAMQLIIMKLTPVDRLSIVAFSNSATRYCPLRSVTQVAQADLRAIVDGLVVGGGANIEAGIHTALAIIEGRTITTARTANVFLMSDGRQDSNSDARCRDPAKVPVYTFGFGTASDNRLLSDAARNSPGGTYSSMPDGLNITEPLSLLLDGLLTVVAQDVQLTLTPRTEDGLGSMCVAPGMDYTHTTENDTGIITVKFGTLRSGDTRKVTVNMKMVENTWDILRYDALLGEAQHSISAQGLVQMLHTPHNIVVHRTWNRFDPTATATFNDDEKPPASSLGSCTRRELPQLVTIKVPYYSRDDVALMEDEVTVMLELNSTTSTRMREGLDLVAVLDVSNSMQGENLASMKKAMQFIIMKLTPLDRLSIVAFSNSATRHCPLRSVTRLAQADLRAIVDGLVMGGGTNFEAGIGTALSIIDGRTTTTARTASVFLMSDGRQDSNSDARDPDPGKVAIYTFGFGKDADHRLLAEVARKSPGGTYSSVPDGQNLTAPLSQLLSGLLAVVAQDVQLTLTPNRSDGDVGSMCVAPGTDYTQNTDSDTGIITVKFGTLFSGETRKIAVNITLLDSNVVGGDYDAILAEVQHMYSAQGHVRMLQTPMDILINRTTNPFDPAATTVAFNNDEKPPASSLQHPSGSLNLKVATASKETTYGTDTSSTAATDEGLDLVAVQEVEAGSEPPMPSQHDEQILSTVSKSRVPLQYLKDITHNFCDKRILGKGGFGVVYKGMLPNGEMIAVKKLLREIPSSQKQFENEVNLLLELEHNNIVRLVGYCYEMQNLRTLHEGKYVFAWNTESLLCLECLPNGSLDKYISDASSGLDWQTRCKIIEGISYGLQYLHENSNQPIIHLDLKPANILLDENMGPKITDFGLSRLFDQTQTIHTAIACGTLGYMPPEFFRGIITPMSDIFSLGVIIMEVITGHRDYPYDIRNCSEKFIESELQNWRNRLQREPGYTSLETDCTQIERCIQIGLICVNSERTKRPKMKKIVNMLQGLESMNWYITNELSSHNIQEKP